MIIVAMGVTGAGKTVVGQRLAAVLGAEFLDADDVHSAAAIAKMKNGVPLDDADRAPWLERLSTLIEDAAGHHRSMVLACSALKDAYRKRLRAAAAVHGADLYFLYLRVTPELVARRLGERSGHYMPASLIQSQFGALEEPSDAIVIDGSRPIEEIVAEVTRLVGPYPE